jgi:hypothetical protein
MLAALILPDLDTLDRGAAECASLACWTRQRYAGILADERCAENDRKRSVDMCEVKTREWAK